MSDQSGFSDTDIAILIEGNDNELRLGNNSRIFGNVRADGENNTLVFDAENDGNYLWTADVSAIGDDAQFRGFQNFIKDGEGPLQLEGKTTARIPWIVEKGILAISDGGNLGSNDGTVTLAGGALLLQPVNPGTSVEVNQQIKLTTGENRIITLNENGYSVIRSEINGEGDLIKRGEGKLILTSNNEYNGTTRIEEGTLQLGMGEEDGSVKGPIHINEAAKLNIDHPEAHIVTNKLVGSGTIEVNSEKPVLFTADNSDFTGNTHIHKGKLSLFDKLGGNIEISEDASLSATGQAGNVVNKGMLILSDKPHYYTYTINGDYHGGANSSISLKTALRGDNLDTDQIVINGNASGESRVFIKKTNDVGGRTYNGIKIISIEGKSDATFTLNGDYNLPSGTPALIAGAYSYTLEKGSVDNPQNGNWYLRSSPIPRPRTPIEPIYDMPPHEDEVAPAVPAHNAKTKRETLHDLPHDELVSEPVEPTAPLMAHAVEILPTELQGLLPPAQPEETDEQPEAHGEPVVENLESAEPQEPLPPAQPQTSSEQPKTSMEQSLLAEYSSNEQDRPEIYQPGVPLYAGYSQFASSLNTLSSMRERTGNRYQRNGRMNDKNEGPNSLHREIHTDAGLIWGRIEAAHAHIQLHDSILASDYDSKRTSVRIGVDQQLQEFSSSRLIGSVWMQHDSAKADLSSPFGRGSIDVNSYGFGSALSWFSDDGVYIDGQGRFSWMKSDIASSTLNRMLADGVKGNGFAFSLEAGKTIAMNDHWSWTPQAQVIWSRTSLNDFNDPYSASVSFPTVNAVNARFGIAVQYAQSWQNHRGTTDRSNLYGIANLHHGFAAQSPAIFVANERIDAGHADRSWREIGLGGSYAFHNDKYAVFGEASYANGLNMASKSHAIQVQLGLRASW